jgi:lipoprotein-releasing system permease protein
LYWPYFLSKKYRQARQRRGICLVWRLAVIGVAMGVTTLTLTQGVLSGFERVFRQAILGFNAHLVVLKLDGMHRPGEEEAFLRQQLGEALHQATPFFYREGLLVAGGRVKGAVFKGINPLTFEEVYDVELRPSGEVQVPAKIKDLLEGAGPYPKIILGEDLAEKLQIQKGRNTVKAFLPTEAPKGEGKQSFQVFEVGGTFSSGLREFDEGFVLADASALQGIYGVKGQATGIEMTLNDPESAPYWAERLKNLLGPGYEVMSWQRLNAPLFQALRLERSMFFVIMAMVVAVAAFNITGVLILMIFDKSREISILRAMGASRRGLRRVFALEGLWIGLTGAGAGILVGVLLAWGIRASGVLKLAKEVYFISELPVEMSGMVLVTVFLASLGIAYLATRFAVARLNRAPLDL